MYNIIVETDEYSKTIENDVILEYGERMNWSHLTNEGEVFEWEDIQGNKYRKETEIIEEDVMECEAVQKTYYNNELYKEEYFRFCLEKIEE